MKPSDRLSEAQNIAAQIQQLRLRLDSLDLSTEEMAQVEAHVSPSPLAEAPAAARPRRPLKSARDQVLMAIGEIGMPMLSRDIQHYLRTVYGVVIDGTRFGSLRKAEMEAFDRGSHRSTWLCYGLTEKGEAIKRLLSRSDFPLEQRVVGPYTGRCLFFATTAKLCEIALRERDRVYDFDEFKVFVADHARDIPGVKNFKKGAFDFENWLEKANEALSNIATRDTSDRMHIAMRLTMLSEKDRYFGTEYAAEDHAIQPPITAETFA